MLRLGTDLTDAFARRELRVLYGQTQAYPYAAQLDSSFDRTQGAYAGTNAITGARGAIFPGLVAVKTTGENVTLPAHAWATTTYDYRPFGLFADYVGGTWGMNFPSTWTQIGVWRGIGSVYELLAPAFDTTSLSTYAAAEDGTAAKEVYLSSNVKGQLSAAVTGQGPYVSPMPSHRLVDYLSANAIIVESLV
ncbi:MAG: hypothetical protein KGL39_42130 [Patescibacteria group bacterium]|nr:hypothetical protein [Patescibacteria group bacterium]